MNLSDDHSFPRPDSEYEYKDIWKNVDELRQESRAPFKMQTSGYKDHEISEHLPIPIGTVKNRIFQARKELQEKLKGY